MSIRKFELTTDFITVLGIKLFRIKALIEFGNVEAGELGGYVEKEENLSQGDNAWVYDDARVYGNAEVYDNAKVYGNAKVCGYAEVYGNAEVCGDAEVYGNAKVCGYAEVCGDAEVYGNAEVCGDAKVLKRTHLLTIGVIGSRDDFTTFFRTKDKEIFVKCGCFRGDIDEFEKAVGKTHKGTKHEKTYKLAIELAKLQIDLED